LTQEQYDGYRALFDNDARLRRLVAELEALRWQCSAPTPDPKAPTPTQQVNRDRQI
jgi:hypothetical protein